MGKYVKKPVTVEAFQFFYADLKGDGPNKWPDWFIKAWEKGTVFREYSGADRGTVFIHTPEGNHEISDGDFIIQGVNGEIYPCKPDIFEATYDEAPAFPVGTFVRKRKGYQYSGYVVNAFRKYGTGEWRYVVEIAEESCKGMLHVFSGADLKAV